MTGQDRRYPSLGIRDRHGNGDYAINEFAFILGKFLALDLI